jgi:hypothetical protein
LKSWTPEDCSALRDVRVIDAIEAGAAKKADVLATSRAATRAMKDVETMVLMRGLG